MGNGRNIAVVTEDLCYRFKDRSIGIVFGFHCSACGNWNPVAEDERTEQDDIIWDVSCNDCPTTARFKVEAI